MTVYQVIMMGLAFGSLVVGVLSFLFSRKKK